MASDVAFSFWWFGQYFSLHMGGNAFLCEVNEALMDVFFPVQEAPSGSVFVLVSSFLGVDL